MKTMSDTKSKRVACYVCGRLDLHAHMDNQNGCPVPGYEDEWTAAMQSAAHLLKEHHG